MNAFVTIVRIQTKTLVDTTQGLIIQKRHRAVSRFHFVTVVDFRLHIARIRRRVKILRNRSFVFRSVAASFHRIAENEEFVKSGNFMLHQCWKKS